MDEQARKLRGDEAIDWFTEELRRSPDQVDALKSAFKARMGLAERPTSIVREARTVHGEEPDDIWDNVPV
ncbi:MAG: hypothetical protein AAGA87_09980 [Pseudomonadota bacterium]